MAPLLLGIDVSHHQGSIDWSLMRHYGIQFAGLKATEGDAFIDSQFARNLRNARAAGVVVFAYHYQRSVATATEQVANIVRVVPKDCPVVVDVEAGSGIVGVTQGIVAGLRLRGYDVPLTYLPRWYWQQLGLPSLAGLPPLWSSRYPDNVIRPIGQEYAEIESRYMHFWQGYGGLPVKVLQFTSSARIGTRAPLDGNAYRGSLLQLRALLSGTPAPKPPSPPSKEDDVKPILAQDLNNEKKHGPNAVFVVYPGYCLHVPNEEALANMRTQWAQAGVDLGDVEPHNNTGWFGPVLG